MNLKEAIRAKLERAGAIAKAAEDENREFTDAERVEVKALIDEAAQLKKDADNAKSDKGLLDQIKAMGTPVADDEAEQLNAKALAGGIVGLKVDGSSLGQAFEKSAQWAAFKERYPRGVGREGRVNIDPLHVGGMKALLGSFNGISPAPEQQGLMLAPWGRELTIRDVITVGRTGSDAVEYARQLTVVNNAAPVPESLVDAIDATPTIGEGYKPQSAMTFEKVTANVVTIAHWLAATKRTLSDAAQMRTLIDSFLRFGLEEELEDQIMDGDGTGENFDGILNVNGTQAQAFSNSPIETIRKAITKVRLGGRARPTAVALNPLDDEALDLAKDLENRYYGMGPFGTGPSTIWGYPRIVTEAVPAGTAIAADWRFAALWDREQATVTVTDSHADFFVRNLIAILAELRAAFGVIRPSAFVIADLTA